MSRLSAGFPWFQRSPAPRQWRWPQWNGGSRLVLGCAVCRELRSMKILLEAILLALGGIALIVMAVRGKPRMLWGKRGTHYFTREQQAVVCSFQGTVLLFGAILALGASLPRNPVSISLIRVNSLVSPMTLISLFFSMPLLVWGASGLLRNYVQSSLTERVRDLAVALIGMVILAADLVQIIVAVRSAFE